MSFSAVILATWLATAVVAPPDGTIDGIVVNLSRDGRPAAEVEVELRAELDGELVPVARTRTDARGAFAFRGVPLDRTLTYVAGANRDGVQYATSKFALGPERRTAHVRLNVRDAETESNPLVLRRHDVVIEPAPGVLHVTEALLVDNPTEKTYVGKARGDAPMPVTFELGIPTDFERLTFEEEFWGRSFALVGGKVVASVPWEPGQRWVRFTYSARNEAAYRRWERAIDAPCERMSVRVKGSGGENIECSLPFDGEAGDRAVFAAAGQSLAAGDAVWVGLGDLPVSWTTYARWAAVAVLALTVASLTYWSRRRNKSARGSNAQLTSVHAQRHQRRRAA